MVQYLVQKLGKDCLKDENNSRDNAFNASSATYGKRFISDRIEKQKKIIDYLFLISPDEMNHCDKYGYNIFTTSVQEGEQEITNYLKERYGINMEHSKGLLKINLFYPVITKEVSSLKRIKYVIKSLMSEGYEGKDGDDAMIIAHYYCNDKEKKGRS